MSYATDELIAVKQHRKSMYEIYRVVENDKLPMPYLYVVVSQKTSKSDKMLDILESRNLQYATDIRKLPSYSEIDPQKAIKYPNVNIVPLIAKAVKRGEIAPL